MLLEPPKMLPVCGWQSGLAALALLVCNACDGKPLCTDIGLDTTPVAEVAGTPEAKAPLGLSCENLQVSPHLQKPVMKNLGRHEAVVSDGVPHALLWSSATVRSTCNEGSELWEVFQTTSLTLSCLRS